MRTAGAGCAPLLAGEQAVGRTHRPAHSCAHFYFYQHLFSSGARTLVINLIYFYRLTFLTQYTFCDVYLYRFGTKRFCIGPLVRFVHFVRIKSTFCERTHIPPISVALVLNVKTARHIRFVRLKDCAR